MNDMKPWYLSRTIWAALVAAASAVAGLAGYPSDRLDEALVTDSLLELTTAISAIVAILGRLWATSRIG